MKHFSFLALLACCPNSCGSQHAAPKPDEVAPAEQPCKESVSLNHDIEVLVSQQHAELSAAAAKHPR